MHCGWRIKQHANVISSSEYQLCVGYPPPPPPPPPPTQSSAQKGRAFYSNSYCVQYASCTVHVLCMCCACAVHVLCMCTCHIHYPWKNYYHRKIRDSTTVLSILPTHCLYKDKDRYRLCTEGIALDNQTRRALLWTTKPVRQKCKPTCWLRFQEWLKS